MPGLKYTIHIITSILLLEDCVEVFGVQAVGGMIMTISSKHYVQKTEMALTKNYTAI